MLLGKSGEQLLIAPERMKRLGQSWNWSSVVDVSDDESEIQFCKEQYCIGTWNVRSMNQGKLDMVKWEMARVNISILGIHELKWTGMGGFNSCNHYISYCGQESHRRNGVALVVNKRVQNAVLGCNLKYDRMISVHFQGKIIQHHSNPSLCPHHWCCSKGRMWFSFCSHCHSSAASLSSSLKCFSSVLNSCPNVNSDPCFSSSTSQVQVQSCSHSSFPPYFLHPTEFCMVLYILFQWSGTPVHSQLAFCKIFCVWRCIPDKSMERDVLHVYLLLCHLVIPKIL